MTELADTLTREEGLSFKLAHRLVALTVKRVASPDEPPAVVIDALLAVAQEALGRRLETSRTKLEAALDPVNFVAVRRIVGGPAPEAVSGFLAEQEKLAASQREWREEKASLLADFPQLIEREKGRHLN